jgi:hypothetical protein
MPGALLSVPGEMLGFLGFIVYHSLGEGGTYIEGVVRGIRLSTEDELSRGFPEHFVLVDWRPNGRLTWVPITHLSPVSPLRQLAKLGVDAIEE